MLVSPMRNELPSQVMPSDTSVTVCEPEYSWVMANAMFSVPSVTMKGGSLALVTSRPLTRPNSAVAAMPRAMATGAERPKSAAILVMTMLPSAMIIPHERSMPAVRMIRVWPMAMVPTTITCCRINEKFCSVRKRSLCVAKKTQASSSAMKGPSVPMGGSLAVMSGTLPSLVAPAQVHAGLHVLAVHAGHGSGRDQGHAGVGVAADLLARLRVFHAGGHAHGGHAQRVLLGGRGDHAGAHVPDAGTTTVDRNDDHVLFPAGGLERLVGAGGGGLVD